MRAPLGEGKKSPKCPLKRALDCAASKVGFCEGFRTTTDRDSATGTGAVVRKRPGKEPAGSWGKECAAAAYGDLIAVGRVLGAVKAPGSSDGEPWIG